MYAKTLQKSFNQNARYNKPQGRVELKVPNGKGGYVAKPVFYGTEKQCEQFKTAVNNVIRTTERYGTYSAPAKPKPKPAVQAKKTRTSQKNHTNTNR